MKQTLSFIPIVFLLFACGPKDVNLTTEQKAFANIHATISNGAIIHEQSMKIAGSLHARGVLSDEELEEVRQLGKKVEIALRAARDTAEAWFRAGDEPLSRVWAMMAQLNETLAMLAAFNETHDVLASTGVPMS